MRVELNPQDLVDELQSVDALREASNELAREWYTVSQDVLLERGENYAEWGGNSESAEVHPVVQSAVPPEWDDRREAWVFTYTHEWSEGFEFGTEPHTIKPVNADFLKFPWPDGPDDVLERFQPMWEDPDHFLEEPEVLLKQVDHPGTPALRFLRDSRTMLSGVTES